MAETSSKILPEIKVDYKEKNKKSFNVKRSEISCSNKKNI